MKSVDQSEADNSSAGHRPQLITGVFLWFNVYFEYFITCLLFKMCQSCCYAVWTLFLFGGLLMLCTSVTQGKKLTEATEENYKYFINRE